MGTNEAANVAVGSTIGYDDRIDSMMSTIGEGPVLWVNVKSLETTGPYAAENMEGLGQGAAQACDRYPYMRIYDWASDVKDEWFIPDGIHFTTPGYAARGRLIADALLEAFPDFRAAGDGRQRRLRRLRQRPGSLAGDLFEERPAVVQAQRGRERVTADRRRPASADQLSRSRSGGNRRAWSP